MKSPCKPTKDKVLMQVVSGVDKTEAGIVIPDTAKDSWRTPVCKVIDVGPDVLQVKVGDRVLVPPSAPLDKVRYENKEYLMIKEVLIHGVIYEEKGK